ncbi:heavy metal-associated isoprenylated plant protein 33-like [Oryza brachyantha]|uniref:heavy metal-associated isoprenylated plant protein 33-like n=1 Tax=Oryza brachyantha TaxID=4533 RepID=UPI001ADCA8F6|nr:heavy metal-associated isoprenylated plant protein 33-like [Oryza brachyantha]
MKKASKFLKDLFAAVVAAVKARSTAVRAKTSVVRTRLVVVGILRNRKLLLSAINRKIHAVVSSGGSQGEYGYGGGGGGEAATAFSHHGGGGGGAGGEQQQHSLMSGVHLLGGSRKAAVLQSLPSFVLEQERSAVVLLSSLPSFAMDRDSGGGGGEEDDEEQETGGKQQQSVIELARGAAECGGVEFRLEDEIDHVADVFIRRFHEQMKLQKLESFKRLCEMLDKN